MRPNSCGAWAAALALLLAGCGQVAKTQTFPTETARVSLGDVSPETEREDISFPEESSYPEDSRDESSGPANEDESSASSSESSVTETARTVTTTTVITTAVTTTTTAATTTQTEQPTDTQPTATQSPPDTQSTTTQPSQTAPSVTDTSKPVTSVTSDTSRAEPGPDEPSRSKRIELTTILQGPELPTGCEVTSLTMVLKFMGFAADKVDLARNYLPKQEFYWRDGVMYGADFRTTFAGDPEDKNSYGCYAPCIVTTANSYLAARGSGMRAHDITGTSLDSLLHDYIDKDIPVMIWITSAGLHEPVDTTFWMTPEGELLQWRAYEHCAVLTGYDLDSQVLYVADPLYGDKTYDLGLLRTRFGQMGSQCVWIG